MAKEVCPLPMATGRWVQALGMSCLIRVSVFSWGLGHQTVYQSDLGGGGRLGLTVSACPPKGLETEVSHVGSQPGVCD